MNNKQYLLAFNRMQGVGARTVMKLMQHWPDLSELFALSPQSMEKAGLTSTLAHTISTYNLKGIEQDLHWQQQPNHYLITWADPAYPALLKEIADAPPVLYAKGNLNALKGKSLAIVGTRKPSFTGGETARYFARQLSEKGVVIVSGLALGIDAQAHQGCLDEDGITIAVMGTGIDRIYPYRHQSLAEKISQKGLLLSEFPLKTSPIAGHFPRRNRIISGLSLATMVIEAAIKSGSLITARLALEQNRDVLAVPGSIYNTQSAGCHFLLQQGAKLITSVEDVLEELRMNVSMTQSKLASSDQSLVHCIDFGLTTIDQIVTRSGWDIATVVCSLAELELQGVIQAVAGGYVRCVNEREYI